MNTADVTNPLNQPVNTSAQAFASLRLPALKQLQDKIHDICIAAQRNGYADLTRKEIQARYELQYGTRIEDSSVSSRVNNLVTAQRLVKGPDRVCTVTGNEVGTVLVPMKQTRLVA